ncbi:hypothetical protein AB0M36_30125 [Actinoplanes sp. NPDC051346]|uniref:hypothetical protein n=1 Tax=Actinoplanes sp. NPDC051346 TaxID=3155048 RepID=UPI003433FD94
MPRGGNNHEATVAADATREAARIQRRGAVQAARIGRTGTIGAAKLNTAGALGVALIAGMTMVINTSVQGCYSLEQARVNASASAVERLRSRPRAQFSNPDPYSFKVTNRDLYIRTLAERYSDAERVRVSE